MKGRKEEKAFARLGNEVRPTTFVLAALIFGIVGLSAFWLLVIAGLAGLCALSIAVIVKFFGARSPAQTPSVHQLPARPATS